VGEVVAGGESGGNPRLKKGRRAVVVLFLSGLLGFALQYVTRTKYSMDGATFIQKRIGMIYFL
jgi:hypothetical protein